MHRTINSLIGYRMVAIDGEMGKVVDFYFDDQVWKVVYLIVKTGRWLSGRKVLISPVTLVRGADLTGTFSVKLSREQIVNGPDIDTDHLSPASEPQTDKDTAAFDGDQHLRSTHAIIACHIETSDGERGQLRDLIIDDETWHIEYLVVEMHSWLDGKKLLIPYKNIKEIQWEASRILLNISKAVLKNCHFYDELKLASPQRADISSDKCHVL
jgi:sporulation protein YlmC with PRC-barrel domain